MPERDSNPHGHSPADVLIESPASLAGLDGLDGIDTRRRAHRNLFRLLSVKSLENGGRGMKPAAKAGWPACPTTI
jgi:hypothetical protein